MRLIAGLLALVAIQDDEKLYANSYKGKAPPELKAPAEQWLGAKEAPSLAKLKGRVVWLQFGFLN